MFTNLHDAHMHGLTTQKQCLLPPASDGGGGLERLACVHTVCQRDPSYCQQA